MGASRKKETPQELGSFIYFPGFWCFDIWGLADPGETAPPRFRQFLETPQDSLPATLSYAKQPTQRPPPTASLSGSSRMQVNPVWLFMTPWTMAGQAPLSVGFPRQEFWSSCHSLLQGIFPTQGMRSCLLHLLHWQADSLPLSQPGTAGAHGHWSDLIPLRASQVVRRWW